MKLSYRGISELISDYGFELSYVQIRALCAKFGDKEEKVEVKEQEQALEEDLVLKEAELTDSID